MLAVRESTICCRCGDVVRSHCWEVVQPALFIHADHGADSVTVLETSECLCGTTVRVSQVKTAAP